MLSWAIVNKYCKGRMKRTLERGLKESESAEMEVNVAKFGICRVRVVKLAWSLYWEFAQGRTSLLGDAHPRVYVVTSALEIVFRCEDSLRCFSIASFILPFCFSSSFVVYFWFPGRVLPLVLRGSSDRIAAHRRSLVLFANFCPSCNTDQGV